MKHPLSLFDLSGRVALVTGASSGLGVTFAEALAAAGADVVLAARRADRLEEVAGRIRAAGRRALPVRCDVTDPEAVEAAVERAVAEMGAIDVLVANAGAVPEGFAMPERVPPALFEESVRVNLVGAWITCQAVVRPMLERGAGSIVIVSSCTGVAGVPHFRRPTRHRRPRCSTCAGSSRRAGPTAACASTRSPRAGSPGPLLLLASDASSYMTGAVLAVDGGTSASVGHTPYDDALFGLHEAVMPAGLGARVLPAGMPRPFPA